MLLNFWNCKHLQTGHGNLDVNNKIGVTVLGPTGKGLRVTVSADIEVSRQWGIAASMGN